MRKHQASYIKQPQLQQDNNKDESYVELTINTMVIQTAAETKNYRNAI